MTALPSIEDLRAENALLEAALAEHELNLALRARCEERGIDVEEVLRPRTLLKDLVAWVARKYGVTPEQIIGPRQTRDVAWPRQEVMWLASRTLRADGRPRWSLPQIGRFLGGRHHTTVLHGIRAHARRLDQADEDQGVVLPSDGRQPEARCA